MSSRDAIQGLLAAGATLVLGVAVAFGLTAFTYASSVYATGIAVWAALTAERASDELRKRIDRGQLQTLYEALHDLLPHVVDPDDEVSFAVAKRYHQRIQVIHDATAGKVADLPACRQLIDDLMKRGFQERPWAELDLRNHLLGALVEAGAVLEDRPATDSGDDSASAKAS